MKKNKQIVKQNSFTEFLLYTTPNGKVKVEIYLHNENIWLTQKLIAILFGCSTDNVSLHLKNIFESAELHENSVTEEFSVTASDSKKYKTKHYNLDAIISVGYRVNSTKATLFRIWATERLKEYIIKGFTMDDERLKNPNTIFGKDYFEELTRRNSSFNLFSVLIPRCSASNDCHSRENGNPDWIPDQVGDDTRYLYALSSRSIITK